MSKDQMQDVFAVNFEFKKGEQPTAEKLTGWVKQTDSAFSDITKAVGDPWMYQSHEGKDLSPEELAQASLARVIGPSDWLSPHGASWNERCNVVATLSANRNSWSLGYPLIRTSGTITPVSSVSDVIKSIEISWDTATTFSGTGNETYFADRKDTPEEVVAEGDYYVDFMSGIITSYSVPLNNITLSIFGLNMLGAGVPWGSSNVIPAWTDGSRCSVIVDPDGPGTVDGETTYLITLPGVRTGSRSTGSLKGTDDGVSYNLTAPGADATNAKYRLPYSMINTFGAGAEVPEGYMLIWDGSRIIPNIRFVTKDDGSGNADPYYIQAIGLEGSLDGLTVRIIITGTSVAEAVNYLMHSTRSNTHAGLNDGQDGKTLAFNAPVSHKSLVDRFGGYLGNISTQVDNSKTNQHFVFVESAYPTNDHPQYLHRAGYMKTDGDDGEGNSANSMRGDIAFTAIDSFALSVDGGGLDTDTYGIKWGGGGGTVARLSFEGGINSSTPIPFGVDGVGISSGDNYGSVAFKAYKNLPFYIRTNGDDEYNSGASIAFDYMNRREMNYVKMLPGYRSTADDPVNLPANMGTIYWDYFEGQSGKNIWPDLENPYSIEQVREWRFRGVSYLSDAENDGIGASGNEKYFTSPSVVGADFFNVYGNAIFFSDTGDGKKTTFHEKISFLESPSSVQNRPAGVYYWPGGDPAQYGYLDKGPTISLATTDRDSSFTKNVAEFGYRFANISVNGAYIKIDGTGDTNQVDVSATNINISANDQLELHAEYHDGFHQAKVDSVRDSYQDLISGEDVFFTNLSLYAEDDAYIGTNKNMYLVPDGIMYIGSGFNGVEVEAQKGTYPYAPGTPTVNTWNSGGRTNSIFMYASTQLTINASHSASTGFLALYSGDNIPGTLVGGNNDVKIGAEADVLIEANDKIRLDAHYIELTNNATDGSISISGQCHLHVVSNGEFEINGYGSTNWQFRITNLANYAEALSGCVYVDNSGFLKLK